MDTVELLQEQLAEALEILAALLQCAANDDPGVPGDAQAYTHARHFLSLHSPAPEAHPNGH